MGRVNRIPFPPVSSEEWVLDYDSGIASGPGHNYEARLAFGYTGGVIGGFAYYGSSNISGVTKSYTRNDELDWSFLGNVGSNTKWADWFPQMMYWAGNWYCVSKMAYGYTFSYLYRWTGASWAKVTEWEYGLAFLVQVSNRLFFMATDFTIPAIKVIEVLGPSSVVARSNLPYANLSAFWGPIEWEGAVHNMYGYLYPSGSGLAYGLVATNRPKDRFNAAWNGVLWQGAINSGIKYKTSPSSAWTTVPVPGYKIDHCATLGDNDYLYTTARRVSDNKHVVLRYNGSVWTEVFAFTDSTVMRALYALDGTYYLTTTNGKIYRKV